jgi:chromate transporter
MNLLWLILQFLWVGSLTFGGGLVAVSLLFDLFVTPGLLTEAFYYQMITIAESTPGPIAINLATYLGVDQFGLLGGVVTTISFLTPSVILIWLLYPIYRRHHHSPYIRAVMSGLRVMIFGVILIAIVRMGFTVIDEVIDFPIASLSLMIVTGLLLPTLKNRPYILLIIGAVFGVLFF